MSTSAWEGKASLINDNSTVIFAKNSMQTGLVCGFPFDNSVWSMCVMYHHATVYVVVAMDAPMMLLYSSVYVCVAYWTFADPFCILLQPNRRVLVASCAMLCVFMCLWSHLQAILWCPLW